MEETCEEVYLWQMLAVSEGTHRTLCFLHRSHAKAFPALPPRASMVERKLGDSEAAGASAGFAASARMWGSPIIAKQCEWMLQSGEWARPYSTPDW